jgi:hypothetical protein
MIDVEAISAAWSKDTSSVPEEWSKQNRARGQCAVTACLVQKLTDGTLVRCVVTKPDGSDESHYATRVEGDIVIDLTDTQFPDGCNFSAWEDRDREYVLGYPETRRRYDVLLRRYNEVRTIQDVRDKGTGLGP